MKPADDCPRSTLAATAMLAVSCLGASPFIHALEQDALTVWVGTNRDVAALQSIGDRFNEELGIPVTVQEIDPLPDKYQQSAATGDGPDIVLWAHDRFGEWAKGGLIAPIKPGKTVREGLIDSAWDAVSFDGKSWGYPIFVEAVGLIYNTEHVDSAPAAFEDIVDMDVTGGVTPIMWDYNNAYFTMPLLMANGGYAFQKVDGSYDGSQTGVNTDGAVKGAQMLETLIESGTMPKGVDYGVMDGAVNKGSVAMVITGPWAWGGLKASGIDFAVAPLPSVDGQASPSFLGVGALALNAASPNKDLAVEFIENYLMTDEGLATWNAKGVLGTLADVSAAAELDDPNIAMTLEIAKTAVPMPSNPEMGAFWAAMEPALSNITSGAQSPQEALDGAANRILGESK